MLQKPSEPAAPLALSIDAIDLDVVGRITFSGSAPSSSVVNVYVANRPSRQALADASGRWLLRPNLILFNDDGVRADQFDRHGNVLAPVAVPFRGASGEATPAPERDGGRAGNDRASASVEVVVGQSLWHIARNVYGTGQAYTIIYEANRNEIQSPDLIYPGQVFSLPEL